MASSVLASLPLEDAEEEEDELEEEVEDEEEEEEELDDRSPLDALEIFFIINYSVADPDLNPDPHVFGLPGSGSGSISQTYGSGSGSCSGSRSFYH